MRRPLRRTIVLVRMRRLGYTPALDGLRGVAIGFVLFAHVFGLVNGAIGVEIFFVLSGFLITALLVNEWDANGTIALTAFYRRRALRLLPALLAGLAVFLVQSLVTFALGDAHGNRSLSNAVESALFGATYVANIAGAWHGWAAPGLVHLWSLATEEQFYLLWPVALAFLLRSRVSRRWIAGGLLVVLAAIALHRLQLSLAGANPRRLYMAPDTSFDAIVTGCALGLAWTSGLLPSALLSRRFTRRAYQPALAIIFVCLAATSWRDRHLYDGLLVAVELSAAVLLLTALCDPGAALTRLLSRPGLVYVGRISYGLYVWHLILMWTMPYGALPGAALTFPVAALSYRYLELPFLRRKQRAEEPSAAGVPLPAPAPA